MKLLWIIAGLGGALGGALAAGAEALPDPMRPPQAVIRAAAVPREPAPVLSAVMTFNERRSAIFNGQLVHDGTAIGAYTIEMVLADGVRYRHLGQTHELHFVHTSNPLKKPAAPAARTSAGGQ